MRGTETNGFSEGWVDIWRVVHCAQAANHRFRNLLFTTTTTIPPPPPPLPPFLHHQYHPHSKSGGPGPCNFVRIFHTTLSPLTSHSSQSNKSIYFHLSIYHILFNICSSHLCLLLQICFMWTSSKIIRHTKQGQIEKQYSAFHTKRKMGAGGM